MCPDDAEGDAQSQNIGGVVAHEIDDDRGHACAARHAAAVQGPDDEQRAAQANAGNGLIHEELRQPQTDIGAERPRYACAAKDPLPDQGVRRVGSHLEHEGDEEPRRPSVEQELGEGHLLAVVCRKHHHTGQEGQSEDPRDPAGESF